MHVIIVRHAKAHPGSPDELRQLTASGRQAANLLGEVLAERRPEAIISSPLRRAVETAEAIAAACGLDPVVDARLSPGATLEGLRAAVDGRGEIVITVGHQPDCSQIVLELTGREVSFPTAGYAEVEL
jgi:phosphohistidine phosphatase SixA